MPDSWMVLWREEVGLDESFKACQRAFRQAFGAGERLFRACGRVNLIGEHVDYHGGPVLPVTLDRAVTVAVRARSDRRLRLGSFAFPGPVEVSLDGGAAACPTGEEAWAVYPLGVFEALESRGVRLGGVDLWVDSTVPVGAGLSSSAALLVATTTAVAALEGLCLSPEEIAEVAHIAETQSVGVPCGIMDSWASALAPEGGALWLDCATRTTREVTWPAGDLGLCLVDSGQRHALTDGGYRQRVEESTRAFEHLREMDPAVTHLAATKASTLNEARDALDPVAFHRARHVVTETARVAQACRTLAAGDFHAFGEVLTASHTSLRDDYAVSTPRLDALVEAAVSSPDVLGARLVGAGFGGAVLIATQSGTEAEVIERLRAFGHTTWGESLDAWVVRPGRPPLELIDRGP